MVDYNKYFEEEGILDNPEGLEIQSSNNKVVISYPINLEFEEYVMDYVNGEVVILIKGKDDEIHMSLEHVTPEELSNILNISNSFMTFLKNNTPDILTYGKIEQLAQILDLSISKMVISVVSHDNIYNEMTTVYKKFRDKYTISN